MLFNEPKLLKSYAAHYVPVSALVSVLFNEPKLLKYAQLERAEEFVENGFSALQRAEIAEIGAATAYLADTNGGFSALQRAEIAEMELEKAEAIQRLTFQCSSTSRNC